MDSQEGEPNEATLPLETRLYLFGDSITFGQHVPTHEVWSTRISQYVSQERPNWVTQVTAVNGETSRDALDRINFSVLDHKPAVVRIQYGLNDANFWRTDQGYPRVSRRSFSANLAEMIERSLNTGTRRVILSTNHLPTKDIDGLELEISYTHNSRIYNQLIRELVETFAESSILLCDIESEFERLGLTGEEVLLPDGVHLNQVGHDAYFQITKSLLDTSIFTAL